jgi:hypothetical protein
VRNLRNEDIDHKKRDSKGRDVELDIAYPIEAIGIFGFGAWPVWSITIGSG